MDKFPKVQIVEEEEQQEGVEEEKSLPPPPEKASVEEVFVKPDSEPVEKKQVDLDDSAEKKLKPKKPLSKKQLEHLARIREKSNKSRAEKVQQRKIKEAKELDITLHDGKPNGIQDDIPPPPPVLTREPPVNNTIIQQGISEERVNQLIQQSIKQTREQIERERVAELIIKQKELDDLNKKMKAKDTVRNLLKRK